MSALLNASPIDCENVFVICVTDVNALADRLYKIIIDTEMRRKMGKKARKRAENFTVTNMALNLVALIKEFKH